MRFIPAFLAALLLSAAAHAATAPRIGIASLSELDVPDAPFAQVLPNLLVLFRVEAVRLEQGRERFVARGRFVARKHGVEKRLHHPAQLLLRPASGAKFIQLRAPLRRQRATVLADQFRNGEHVISGRHERVGAAEEIGEGPVFVDREIVNHRIHRKRERLLQLTFRFQHDRLVEGARLTLDVAADHPDCADFGKAASQCGSDGEQHSMPRLVQHSPGDLTIGRAE